ncbi:hypothetical protein [Micromonospora craterilacus]|nr:hypothetical protein [Micromonospora craterilacus]
MPALQHKNRLAHDLTELAARGQAARVPNGRPAVNGLAARVPERRR